MFIRCGFGEVPGVVRLGMGMYPRMFGEGVGKEKGGKGREEKRET